MDWSLLLVSNRGSFFTPLKTCPDISDIKLKKSLECGSRNPEQTQAIVLLMACQTKINERVVQAGSIRCGDAHGK